MSAVIPPDQHADPRAHPRLALPPNAVTAPHRLGVRIQRIHSTLWPPARSAELPDANGLVRGSASALRRTTAADNAGMSLAGSRSTCWVESAPTPTDTRTSPHRWGRSYAARYRAWATARLGVPDLRYHLTLTHYWMLAGTCLLIGGSSSPGWQRKAPRCCRRASTTPNRWRNRTCSAELVRCDSLFARGECPTMDGVML